jgi:hypothetical protein
LETDEGRFGFAACICAVVVRLESLGEKKHVPDRKLPFEGRLVLDSQLLISGAHLVDRGFECGLGDLGGVQVDQGEGVEDLPRVDVGDGHAEGGELEASGVGEAEEFGFGPNEVADLQGGGEQDVRRVSARIPSSLVGSRPMSMLFLVVLTLTIRVFLGWYLSARAKTRE